MSEEKAENLSGALLRGKQAKQKLAPATDRLNETLAQIERALAELQLGVSGSIEISREDIEELDGSPTHDFAVAFLTFRKQGKEWRLSIASGVDGIEESFHAIPLLNASRELRLLAVEKLPTLIDHLVEKAEHEVAVVEKAQTEAAALLETLKRSKAGLP